MWDPQQGSAPGDGVGGRPQRGPAPWGGGRRMRLLGPVALSLLIQVPAAVWMTVHAGGHGAAWPFALHLALVVAGPLALLGARRLPGPTVAVVAGLALLD
ncbi:MAG: hypothetical protein WA971_05775, partial [Microbacterium sp.]